MRLIFALTQSSSLRMITRSAHNADPGAVFAVQFALTRQFGRYVYRMTTGLLDNAGWLVNHECVERIRRQDGGGSGKAPVWGLPNYTQGYTETGVIPPESKGLHK